MTPKFPWGSLFVILLCLIIAGLIAGGVANGRLIPSTPQPSPMPTPTELGLF